MSRAVRGSLVGLALALLFWFSLAPGTDRISPPTPPAPGPASTGTTADPTSVPAPEVRRSEAAFPTTPAPVAAPASAPASAPSGRYAFEVLVIDDEARPVGGATVTAFTERTTDGRTKRVAVDPPNEWTTDAAGRCPLHVPMPRFGIYVGLHLAAEKAGVGRSGSQWVSPETPPRIRLVLFSPVRVEGRVMGADGLPAKDATVHFSRENGPEA